MGQPQTQVGILRHACCDTALWHCPFGTSSAHASVRFLLCRRCVRPWLLISPFCPLCKARALPKADSDTLSQPSHAHRAPNRTMATADDEETAQLLSSAAAAIGAAREATLLHQAVATAGAATMLSINEDCSLRFFLVLIVSSFCCDDATVFVSSPHRLG